MELAHDKVKVIDQLLAVTHDTHETVAKFALLVELVDRFDLAQAVGLHRRLGQDGVVVQ